MRFNFVSLCVEVYWPHGPRGGGVTSEHTPDIALPGAGHAAGPRCPRRSKSNEPRPVSGQSKANRSETHRCPSRAHLPEPSLTFHPRTRLHRVYAVQESGPAALTYCRLGCFSCIIGTRGRISAERVFFSSERPRPECKHAVRPAPLPLARAGGDRQRDLRCAVTFDH